MVTKPIEDWRFTRPWLNEARQGATQLFPDIESQTENIFSGPASEHWLQGLGRWLQSFSGGLSDPRAKNIGQAIGFGSSALNKYLTDERSRKNQERLQLQRNQVDSFFKMANLLKPDPREFGDGSGGASAHKFKYYEALADDPTGKIFKRGDRKWFSEAQFANMPFEMRNMLREHEDSNSVDANMYRDAMTLADRWYNGEELTPEEQMRFTIAKDRLSMPKYEWVQDDDTGKMVRREIPGMNFDQHIRDIYGDESNRVPPGTTPPDQLPAPENQIPFYNPRKYWDAEGQTEEFTRPEPTPTQLAPQSPADPAQLQTNPNWSPLAADPEQALTKPIPLSDTARKEYANASQAFRALNDAVGILLNEDGTTNKGILNQLKFGTFTSIQASKQYRDYLDAISQAAPLILNLRTGAAFNSLEKAFVTDLMEPSLFESEETMRKGIFRLLEELQNRSQKAYYRELEGGHPAYNVWKNERDNPKPANTGNFNNDSENPVDWTDEQLEEFTNRNPL